MVYEIFHAADDTAKVAEIAASIERDGWQGSPLVAWGTNLMTGAHRHAAWMRVHDRDDSDLPIVQIADLAAEYGNDWETIAAEEGCDSIDSADLVYAIDRAIPAAARAEYGIDVH